MMKPEMFPRSAFPRAPRVRGLALAILLVLGAPVCAREGAEIGADPAVERHMRELSAELRCLQCQNQNLADSEAPLAVDLRQQIREMIARGQTDEQVRQYLVDRYGDFVLYRPPVKGKTVLLWFGPGLLLVGGVLAMVLSVRRRRARLGNEPLAPEADEEQGALS